MYIYISGWTRINMQIKTNYVYITVAFGVTWIYINHPFCAKVEFSAGIKVFDTLPLYPYVLKTKTQIALELKGSIKKP